MTTSILALAEPTATIVTAFLANPNHRLEPALVPALIGQVHGTLAGLGAPAPAPEPQQPAVPIAKSVTRDYIVCLEDGRRLKSLKRHLRTAYGLSPDEYRAKWGLPHDYPMTAPGYSARRSALAKAQGLGRVD